MIWTFWSKSERLRWSRRWKMGTEIERHAWFAQKSGGLVSIVRMNLLGSCFILGYFRNLEQLFAPWCLLPVFSCIAQTQKLTHKEHSISVLKPCLFLGTHFSFGKIYLLFNDSISKPERNGLSNQPVSPCFWLYWVEVACGEMLFFIFKHHPASVPALGLPYAIVLLQHPSPGSNDGGWQGSHILLLSIQASFSHNPT